MVGEIGSGKSTLINAMVDYMLGVQCINRMWCEITETKENQAESQTNAVTVCDVFADQSPFSLTVFDTPGYGSTKGPEVSCAKTHKGEPVYFTFDNSHCETFNEKKKSGGGNRTNITLQSTYGWLSVLKNRIQLLASLCNLKAQIILLELKTKELEQTKAALLQKQKKKKLWICDCECEVDEPYKIKVPINSGRWHMSKEATCCSVCEENCHYPGCWWVRNLKWCGVMNEGKCTVCTRRCDHTDHAKKGKIYEIKTRKVKRSFEYLKNKYEKQYAEEEKLIIILENEIKVKENNKTRLEIALKTDSASTLQHLDFLIEKVKKTERPERTNFSKGLHRVHSGVSNLQLTVT
uniref:Septin-type G domain-containing protein n=1 Tax=Electrophorus electricus TaxID=8005 RepID=A0A4W4DSK3_ELEEL